MKTTFDWIATHALHARKDDQKPNSVSIDLQKSKYNKKSGHKAEEFIAQKLTAQGYTICARNYQRRFGEVDIIAQKDDTVAFVEVKFRNNPLFDVGTIITRTKQKKMIAIAKYFMATHELDNCAIQFDVAFVFKINGQLSTEYIANAFCE